MISPSDRGGLRMFRSPGSRSFRVATGFVCARVDHFMPLVDRWIADVWPCGSLARDAGSWIADWRLRIWIAPA
eukprot:6580627-Prorocentrum_lima.AAC.1